MKILKNNMYFILVFTWIFTNVLSAEKEKFEFDIIKCDEKYIEEPSGDVEIEITLPGKRSLTKVERKIIQKRLKLYFKETASEIEDELEKKNDQIKELLEEMEKPESDPKKIAKRLRVRKKRLNKYYVKKKKEVTKEAKEIIIEEWGTIIDNDKTLKKAKRKKLKKQLKIGIKILGGTISIVTTVLGVLATVAGTAWNPAAPASILAIVAGSAAVLASSISIVSGIKDLVDSRKDKIQKHIEAEKQSLEIFINATTTDKKWKKQAKIYISSYNEALNGFKIDIAKMKKEATKLDEKIEKEKKKIKKLDEKIELLQEKTESRFAYFKKAKNKKKNDLKKLKKLNAKHAKVDKFILDTDGKVDEMIDKIIEMENALVEYEVTGKQMQDQIEAYKNANPSTKNKILTKMSKISGVGLEKLDTISGHVSTIASIVETVAYFLREVAKVG
ncbi:hypothetical protein [Candidatus Uabimicrobium sp. HlEnr_7]|uniref:hypothetical protein n=1 Tax=Candidatus Uabimicrobium helgolandensis TaxID=3095367 RepID=UPI0035591E77